MSGLGPEAAGDGGSHRDMTLEQLLEAFSDASPTPGGGGAAVVAVALSASLCAMAARLSSRHIERAGDIATEALAIRDAMVPLCDEDGRSYLAVIAASRAPVGPDPADHRRRVSAALSAATAVPMATVEAGARLARLAARLADAGNPSLRGDAVVAAVLAGAGAEAAAELARINLAELPDDERHVVLESLLAETARWVQQARRVAAVEP